MALDKSKPYGQIFGQSEDGARFTQDGVRYDNQGNEVGREAPVEKPKPKAVSRVQQVTKVAGVRRKIGLTMPHDRENVAALRAEELSE